MGVLSPIKSIVEAYLGLNDQRNMAISRVVGSLALVPMAVMWALRSKLPPAALFLLGHLSLTGLAVSFATMESAADFTVGMLGKRKDAGKVRLWSWMIFWPYHLGLRCRLWWRKKFSSEPLYHEIISGWYLGGWPWSSSHLPPGNPAVVDVTCELPRAHHVGPYVCLPTWDTHGPTTDLIEEGVQWAVKQRNSGQPVYIHCAHGHGRSATILCACLIAQGQVTLLDEGIALMKSRRSKVKMNDRQKRSLHQWLEKRKNGQQDRVMATE